jgi:hypothetical protein
VRAFLAVRPHGQPRQLGEVVDDEGKQLGLD